MKRTASAHWEGDLKTGKGNISTQSTVLNKTQYSFNTRFENGAGTNPEELLAAAHAGCFTMQLSVNISQAGFTVNALDTVATLTLEGTTITGVHLSVKGNIPNITAAQFTEMTKDSEQNCIISRALKMTITSDAQLV